VKINRAHDGISNAYELAMLPEAKYTAPQTQALFGTSLFNS